MEQMLSVDNMTSFERNGTGHREYFERTRNPLGERIKSMNALLKELGASIVSVLKVKNAKEKKVRTFPMENVAKVVVSIIANNKTSEDYPNA